MTFAPWRRLLLLFFMLLDPGASRESCDEPWKLSDADFLSCNPLCRLPLQPRDACYIYPHDMMPGGIGAKITSVIQYVFFAVESGCTYLHRRLEGVGHRADAARVESYFNIGEQCVEAADFLKNVSLKRVLLDAKEARAGAVGKPFPPQCAHAKGVLCEVPRASGLQIVSKRSEEMAQRILRARFYKRARQDPDKAVTWFHPAGNDRFWSPLRPSRTSVVNVVIHVRRGDVNEGTGHGRYTSTEDVEKVLKHLCMALQTVNRSQGSSYHASIHIASDGTEADFPGAIWSALVGEKCPTESSLQFQFDSALKTFSHFVAADVLLYGVSSFPKLAALIYHEGVSRAYAKYERRKSRTTSRGEPVAIIHNPVVIEELFGMDFLEELVRYLQARSMRERQSQGSFGDA